MRAKVPSMSSSNVSTYLKSMLEAGISVSGAIRRQKGVKSKAPSMASKRNNPVQKNPLNFSRSIYRNQKKDMAAMIITTSYIMKVRIALTMADTVFIMGPQVRVCLIAASIFIHKRNPQTDKTAVYCFYYCNGLVLLSEHVSVTYLSLFLYPPRAHTGEIICRN